MGRLWACGFELDSVTDEITTHNNSAGTASTISSTQAHSGTFSSAFATTSKFSVDIYEHSVQTDGSGSTIGYVRAYVYFTGYPNANATLLDLTSNLLNLGGIYMNSSGQLGINYGASPTYGTSLTSAVSKNTWHYIELKVNTTSANSQVVTARLDGTQFDSQTGTQTLVANSVEALEYGIGVLESSITMATMYMDDIVINDGTGSFCNTWPGAGFLVRATPSAAGDSNTWLTGSGGTAGASNNFTRVKEVTPDGATTYNLYRSPTATPSDLYEVSVSSIPAGATVNAVMVGVWYAGAASSANSQFELQIEKTTGGTISRSSAITPNSTTFKINANAVPKNYPLILYNDPDGSPWTPTTIASMQIGIFGNSASTNYAEISTVWAYVDYTPSSGPPPSNIGGSTLMTMGMG